MTLGTVRAPTKDDLRQVASDLGMSFSDEDLRQHLAALIPSIAAFNIIDKMPDEKPGVTYPRAVGYRPSGGENTHGAWYIKTTVTGAPLGQAQGQEDCAEGQCVPGRRADDERRLDAGRLCARCRCDRRNAHSRRRRHNRRQGGLRIFLLFRRQPHELLWPGPQPAPHGLFGRRLFLGQRAVSLRLESAEWRWAATKGGSIRIPSAFCGIYGMKPTHGLVPYTGIMPIELTIDHTGPMTATVEDNALLLEVLAGPDGLDPRQYGGQSQPYREALGQRCRRRSHRRRRRGIRPPAIRCRKSMRSCARRRRGSKEWARPSKPCRSRCIAWDCHLAVCGRRGRDDADDARQRLRLQLAGPLCHLAAWISTAIGARGPTNCPTR